MTSWLIRCFVRDADRVDDPAVRYAYGRLAGCAGLAANLLLFVGKLAALALWATRSTTCRMPDRRW